MRFTAASIFAGLGLCFCTLDLHGATWYVTPAVPALPKVTAPGDEIVFKTGVYRGPYNISKVYTGVTFRSEVKWGAIIDGAAIHCISTYADTHRVTFDGFEVRNAGYSGIKINGNFTAVRNCWIHNNALNGIEAHSVTGFICENNLVELNGTSDRYDHGIYGDGVGHLYQNNIVRRNASHGMHLYSGLSDSLIIGNTCYDNPSRQILIRQADGGLPNSIISNTCIGGMIGIGVFGTPTSQRNIIIHNTCSRNSIAPLLLQWDNPTVFADFNTFSRQPAANEVPLDMLGGNNRIDASIPFVEP